MSERTLSELTPDELAAACKNYLFQYASASEAYEDAHRHGYDTRDAGNELDAADDGHSIALRFLREKERSAGRADALREMQEWQDEDDRPLPEDGAIDTAFPTNSGSHYEYAEAMRLVGAKRSKGALVALVNWLLVRAGDREETQRNYEEALRECDDRVAAAEADARCPSCMARSTAEQHVRGLDVATDNADGR